MSSMGNGNCNPWVSQKVTCIFLTFASNVLHAKLIILIKLVYVHQRQHLKILKRMKLK